MGVLDRRRIFRSLLTRVRSLMGGGVVAIGLYEDGQVSVRLQEGFDRGSHWPNRRATAAGQGDGSAG